VPTPDAHLDTKGSSSPAPGEGPVGLRGTHQPHRHALCLEGGDERLEYRVLKGSCDSEEVLGYLDALGERASPAKPCVVVLWTTRRFTPPG
jgi:hypothetical protein